MSETTIDAATRQVRTLQHEQSAIRHAWRTGEDFIRAISALSHDGRRILCEIYSNSARPECLVKALSTLATFAPPPEPPVPFTHWPRRGTKRNHRGGTGNGS